MSLLKELVVSSPLLIIGFGLLYYFSQNKAQVSSNQQRQDREVYDRPIEAEAEAEEEDDEGVEPEEVEFGQQEDNDEQIENPPAAGPSSKRQRVVGAKKSKSLARKDRIRAYNEQVRQQAEEEKEAQRLFEEQHYEQIRAEKEQREKRHAEAEAKIRSRKEKERQQEEHERSTQGKIRERILDDLDKYGKAQLQSDQDLSIAESLSIKHGFIVEQGKWVVQLDDPTIVEISQEIGSNGRMSFDSLAQFLQNKT